MHSTVVKSIYKTVDQSVKWSSNQL